MFPDVVTYQVLLPDWWITDTMEAVAICQRQCGHSPGLSMLGTKLIFQVLCGPTHSRTVEWPHQISLLSPASASFPPGLVAISSPLSTAYTNTCFLWMLKLLLTQLPFCTMKMWGKNPMLFSTSDPINIQLQ